MWCKSCAQVCSGKYCGDCGKRLIPSHYKCVQCGSLQFIVNRWCDECGNFIAPVVKKLVLKANSVNVDRE